MLFPTANLILLLIFGYFLGSIPFGFLISRAKGINIRKVGSGNIGGTNVSRALGLKWGLLVTILDLLKGVIPVYLATKFLAFDWQIALVALSPVLGHIFPVWLNFRGGKGMATTVGALFVLLGWKFFLMWILAFIFVLAIFQIMSFASLSVSSLLPLVFWFSSFSFAYYVLGVVLAILIWWAHRENLKRIKEWVEPKFKFKKSL
ncbi:glycerol-3-phosphate 1-O-acyltransferase PlsY [Patescibacteria group bacterium]|nr:glycerol-3-phosphate 1-O-acyltransferase PlsY [Patescibacteria group bacterium]